MKRKIVTIMSVLLVTISIIGCGKTTATQDEAVDMLNKSDQVEIEVAELDEQKSDSLNGLTGLNEVEEQGTEKPIEWVELASLETNPEMRSAWDTVLGITTTDTGKEGMFYVDEEDNQVNNNTLRTALYNSPFASFIDVDEMKKLLTDAVATNYTDIDAEDTDKAFYAGINGYFNLLPDYEPNFANMDATLQRNEFMAMLFRADTPVQELTEDTKFTESVGETAYNIYAQNVADNSYLDLESKSLDEMTYTSTITRAEAIYMIVSRYYSDELNNTDLSTTTITFKDAKDAGDIATTQNIDTTKDYWKSNILNYAIQNPDAGLPTDLYKALIVASDKGIIDSTQSTRWDEPLTRSEAIELLINTYRKAEDILSINNIGIEENDTEAVEDKVETAEDLIKKWGDLIENSESATEADRYAYTSDRNRLLNNRPEEEQEADAAADGVVGYDVRYDADGYSYLVDVLTGKEYHFLDMLPNGVIYDGQYTCRADVIRAYRYYNPDTTRTDDQIAAGYGL